jgi:hypothetical protein
MAAQFVVKLVEGWCEMAKNPFQGDDVDPFSGARDEEGDIKREEPKKMSFKQAFAAARKAGDKTFEFQGKKYSTRTKEEPSEKTLDRVARKQREEDKGPSESDIDRMAKKFDKPKSNLGEFGSKGKNPRPANPPMFKKGGSVSSASKRADGCAVRGKTRGKMV